MRLNYLKFWKRMFRGNSYGLGSESFEDVLSELKFKDFTSKNIIENKFVRKMENNGTLILSGFIVLMFAGFLYQAYHLQIVNGDLYLAKSDNNQFTTIPILSQRGRILDRNDKVLAWTEKIEAGKNINILENNFDRKYVENEGISHVLGYVNSAQKDDSGKYWQNNFKGVSGIEAYYDQLLAGRPGKRIFEKDSEHNLNQSFVTEFPIEGKDVKLSIDSELSAYAEKKMRAFVLEHRFQAGSAVIMDIETGEIIMMTNYPEYNVNKMLSKDKTEQQKYLNDINVDKSTPLLNRAIAGTYAPGSTLKTVFALAGLHLGLIDPVTSIFSAGFIEVQSTVDSKAKTIFRDWKKHGWVNVRTALANSSDVFFYAIGGGYENQKGMGITKLAEWSNMFGVDTLTGIDLGGERAGNIPTPDWKRRIFKDDWRLGDTYISSIGQFGFLVTPISLTRMSAALANNGYMITPKLRIDGEALKQKKIKVDVNDDWYKVVQDGMRMTVTVGTAKRLNSELLEISGKSGTAEVGVKKDKIQSWITGYFPAKNPKYAYTFLCELGVRDVSPTPNLLARDVIEKMYFSNEYFRKIEGYDRPVKATSTQESVIDTATTTDIVEIISR